MSYIGPAFNGCTSLESVYITDLEAWCNISFGDSNLSNPMIKANNLYLNGEIITGNIVLSDNVTIIPYGTFKNSTITSISIPDSVTSIENCAFYNCSSLTSITFGENSQLETIGAYTFYNCTSLESITIPNGVTSISVNAFSNCASITSVYYKGIASQWAYIKFGDSSANPLYYGGNLYLNGTLATDIMLEGITAINAYAFYGCTSLTSVTIGDGVTSIGTNAFWRCISLTNVYYSGTVDEWNGITMGNTYSDPTYYGATIYYYSDSEPDYTDGYNYWYYDGNGEIVVWTEE